jgi:ABC-type phosphate/phosphonate transport system substrate-binding protein
MTRPLLAALPMYDAPPLRPAWDALWQALRDQLRAAGIDAPEALTRDPDYPAQWRDPALVVGQTCGMPYRLGLWRHLDIVGAFDFALPDCPPGYYNSAIVTRAGAGAVDAASAVFAVNSLDSQSGWHALMGWLGHETANPLMTGSHFASLAAVSEGRADAAAIDAVSLRIAARMGLADGTETLARTRPTPGLPLVTARGHDAGLIASVVAATVAALPPAVTGPLGIRGFARFSNDDYLDAARF